jgi:outer membrane protein TolC
VELARVEERAVAVRRAKAVAAARLNALVHEPSGRAVPLPADGPVFLPPPSPEELVTRALAVRPDLKGLAARVAAEEAAVAAADREYKPDVELLAAYDGFWQDAGGRPLQWQVGARVNLPVRRSRRDGALAEAHARLAQRQAERDRLVDQIGFRVREAYEQVRESDEVVRLYETKLLPATTANVKEAQSAYATAKVPFFTLVEAQRNLFTVKERLIELKADVVRRRAALDRTVGESFETK